MFDANPTGLAAIFGPASKSTAEHISSVSEALGIPHVETRWNYRPKSRPLSVNVHPHPAVVGKAYADLIRAMGWKSFIIIYENEESLVRLQEIIKIPKSFTSHRISLWQLDPYSNDYRPMLKRIKDTKESNLVLDCAFEKINNVLNQAKEVDLIDDYMNFLITTLDVDRINLGPLKYVEVNITGYRMVDPHSPEAQRYRRKWDYMPAPEDAFDTPIGKFSAPAPEVPLSLDFDRGKYNSLFSSNALMYDAVQLLAKAMDEAATV